MSVADQCAAGDLMAVSLHRQVSPAADVYENDVFAGDLRAVSLHRQVRPAIQAAEGLEAECVRPGDQPVIDARPLVP